MVNVMARAGLVAYRDAGFESYLVRPVRPVALLQQLGAGPRAGAETERPAPAAPVPAAPIMAVEAESRPRVLLVEDNDINALLARRMAESAGCEVAWVKNGLEAIQCARRWVEETEPPADLILMDIFMPHVDGVEAAQAIRALYAEGGTEVPPCPPIVALTANAFPEDRARYKAAGMDDYLSKPFDRAALEALMARWLTRRLRRRTASPAA